MADISLEVYGYNFLQAGGMADYIAFVLALDLYKRQKKNSLDRCNDRR